MHLCSNIVVIMLLFWPTDQLHTRAKEFNWCDVTSGCSFAASFLHQKCFSDSPRDIYCRSQNMTGTFHTNICWDWCPQYIQDTSWFLLSLLRIDISAFSGPSDNIIQVDELNAIGIHMVLELCSHDMQLDHTHRPQPHKISMSENISENEWDQCKMSEICYQIRLVYICASKLLDEALLVHHFLGKPRIMLELWQDLKAADHAQNYAGIVFSSLILNTLTALTYGGLRLC